VRSQHARKADILAVFAHPDDESWGCAGALSTYGQRGMKCYLVTATAGEMGFKPELREAVSEKERKEMRRAELAEAAGIIGLAGFEILELPDGGLEDFGIDSISPSIADRIERLSPRLVVTFDETGVTGHRDHISIHKATTKAFFDVAPEGSRLLYNVLPEKVTEAVQSAMAEAGILVSGSGFVLSPWNGLPPQEDGSAGAFFVPNSRISVAMDVRAMTEVKKAAILAHRSQVGEAAMLNSLPKPVLEAFLGWEHYQLASGPEYPEVPAADLFEGMK
jgi:N-acetyl-1-D-myo-inositol-2-amino-2-deoxy-alpha-D-glucopyranoside deacetylase